MQSEPNPQKITDPGARPLSVGYTIHLGCDAGVWGCRVQKDGAEIHTSSHADAKSALSKLAQVMSSELLPGVLGRFFGGGLPGGVG